MIIGYLKEAENESRVSLTPDTASLIAKLGLEILVEKGAGEKANYPDSEYESVGVKSVSRSEIFSKSDIIGMIHNLDEKEMGSLRTGQILIGNFFPLVYPDVMKKLAEKKVTTISLDAIPRITRAQSMDILSSQATVSGYKAVLYAAMHLQHFFPMLTTAAGTITPAKVLILGAGVAGLQAIATAKRLGGAVEVFDTRPEVKEQVQSLGAKFIEVEGAADASAAGGYAVEQSEDYKNRQKEMIAKHAIKSDVIITTALIPGKKAPVLISGEMVDQMKKGSVIVDLASAFGGNCEYTKNNEIINKNGITIVGEPNLPGTVPADASKMFSKNILNFLKILFDKEGKFNLNFEDEIIAGGCVTHNGEITHKGLKG